MNAGVSARRSRWRPAIGWICVAALVLYAWLLQRGVGPAPNSAHPQWWQPTSFLRDALEAGPLYFLIDPPLRGVGVGMLPALGLLVGILLAARSALARTLGLAACLACLLFLFYGLRSPGPEIWGFFGWRATLSMCGLAAVVAAALASPLLAASWLRQPPALRVAIYAPVFVGAILLLRDVTGTNPKLQFAISPWPVVPFFGVERAVPLVALLLGCAALGLAVGGRFARSSGATFTGVAVVLALATGWAKTLIMKGPLVLALALGLAGLAALLARAARRRGGSAGAASALRMALGILLLALPVIAGEALAARDWTITRERRAQQVIDALARYYAREQIYPDSLGDLVKAKDLPAVPEPQVGSGLFETPRFSYQAFGTSYLLEFSAPDWVQCAYSPPYAEGEGDDDGAGAPPGDEGAGDASAPASASAAEASGDAPAEARDDRQAGAWSCPSKPPELW